MNLLSFLDLAWFSFLLGAILIVFGVLRVYKRRAGILGWAGPIVLTICGLVLLYNGFLKLHKI
jgi:hypothetical protein